MSEVIVYLIKCEVSPGEELYKCGVSKALKQRMKEIQTGCPYKITSVCWRKFDTRAEALHHEHKWHLRWDSYKTRLGATEWFKLRKQHVDKFKFWCTQPFRSQHRHVDPEMAHHIVGEQAGILR